MTVWQINAWKLFLSGGPVMWPILFCSIFAFGILIEKIWYFSVIGSDIFKFKQEVFENLRKHKIKEAVAICEFNPSPIAQVFKAGILKFGSSREEIKETMEDMSFFEVPRLEKRLSALATIANIAPLLGLLGTVAGIIGSFHTIQVRSVTSTPVAPGELVGGIGEALVATLAGLLVAIPTFVVYNYCVSRVKNIVLEMERAATELVDFLSQLSVSKSSQLKGDQSVEI